VIVIAFFFVYQQLENYLIAPRVLRNTVNMPAVAVLLVALVAGAATFDDSRGTLGLGMFVLLAAVLPVVTGVLAATGTVRGWLDSLV
jgi:predicted PurR-regulated permease PerM